MEHSWTSDHGVTVPFSNWDRIPKRSAAEIDGRESQPLADGHANCFIETGFGKAILIDFNYDIQPVPGHFPLPIVGPMSLLKETRLNHLGKLAFRPVYWNMLLPGRHIPLVGSRMSTRGKRMDVLASTH